MEEEDIKIQNIDELADIRERRALRAKEREKHTSKERNKSKFRIILESKIMSRMILRIMICSAILVLLLIAKVLMPKFGFIRTVMDTAKLQVNRQIDISYIGNKAKEAASYINEKYNLNIDKYIPVLSKDVNNDKQTQDEGEVSNEENNKDNNNVASNNQSNDKKVAVTAVSIIDTDVNEIKEKKYSFIKPISGTISSNFGARISDGGVVTPYHEGTDIANVLGTSIKSIMDGKVISVQHLDTGLGKSVRVQNGDVIAIYGHMSKTSVSEGQEIKQGDIVGEVGNTGAAKGYHLHLAITYQGRYVDPEKLIKF